MKAIDSIPKDFSPCDELVNFLKGKTDQEAWDKCPYGDWMAWYIYYTQQDTDTIGFAAKTIDRKTNSTADPKYYTTYRSLYGSVLAFIELTNNPPLARMQTAGWIRDYFPNVPKPGRGVLAPKWTEKQKELIMYEKP